MKSKTSKKGAALVLAAALTLSLQTASPLAAVSSGENAQAEQTAQENTAADTAAQEPAMPESYEWEIQSNKIPGWPQGPKIIAETGIVMDLDSGEILYAKGIDEKRAPASITKILTALIVMEQCPLDEMVTYSNEAVNSINWQTDSNIGIKAGEQITVEQSLYGLLVGSANEVANALAEHVSGSVDAFAELMNERAAELGCVDSHFANANGIFDENHYTSAHDMALIAKAFFSNDLLSKISGTSTYTIPRSDTVSEELLITCRNQLLPGKSYAYEYLVGSKTGYTSEARQTLVSCAQKDGRKLICVVMKEESPSQFTDTIELFNYGFSSFHMVNVADADSRYTVGNELFFEADADVFGSSSPLLAIDFADSIILPNTAEYEDTQSTLSYDDLEKDSPFSELQYHLTSGGYITENTRGAVIHESLAAQNGLQIGDKLELSGENGDTVSVTITGLFRSAGRIEDKQPAAATAVNRIENQIFIDNETCKELLKDSSFYQLSIYTENPENINSLRSQVQEISGGKADIRTSDALYRQMSAPLEQISRTAKLMLALTLSAGTIIVSLLLCMWMRTRHKEMAVFLSLGKKKSEIILQVFCESGIVFLVSVLAAALAGNGVQTFLQDMISGPETADTGLTVLLGIRDVGALAGLGTILVFIALCVSLIPALRANPKDILARMEG